jgi:acyl-coenzyme A synthetase/AMP-(fatty) acid ligase
VPVIDHWWQTETGYAIAANPLGIEGAAGQDRLAFRRHARL